MAPTQKVTLGAYLLERISQLGTRSIMGVPGDFNLAFLDLIEDHPKLEWIGNVNELNAAYAADGYARASQGLHNKDDEPKVGCVVTTFGVGELSAINGIAGAYAEHTAVVHLVGTPSTRDQTMHSLLHHTLGPGAPFDAYEIMSRQVSAGTLQLLDYKDDLENAARRIDQLLELCVHRSLPVYISLPSDLVNKELTTSRLSQPLDLALRPNDEQAEAQALAAITKRAEAAKNPVILVDACAIRHRCLDETLELIRASGYPVFTSPMGKTAIAETDEQYGGIYIGSNTHPDIKAVVESSDLLISIGAILSDFNTASFSYRTSANSTLHLHSSQTTLGFATYANVGMKRLLPKLAAALKKDGPRRLEHTKSILPRWENKLPSREEEGIHAGPNGDLISQAWLWPRFGQFFRPGDQISVETGTSSFGAIAMALPGDHTRIHAQILYGSIGWAPAATLGIALAARESGPDGLGRVFCFVGDGSLQLTIQELSSFIRQGLNVTLIVLRNDGYEIERQIHGPQRRYNDVAPWNHEALLKGFSGYDIARSTGGNEEDAKASHAHDVTPSKTRYVAARTKDELNAILSEERFNKHEGVTILELFMRRGDAPKELVGQAQLSSKTNE